MSVKISGNRVWISEEFSTDDAIDLDCIENLKYIQINDYLEESSYERIESYIVRRNPSIQFRVFGFYLKQCDLSLLLKMTRLKNLCIDSIKQVSDFDIICHFHEIEELRIEAIDLDEVHFLSNVNDGLQKLSISTQKDRNNIDISILSRFKELETLFLYKILSRYNVVCELPKLSSLTVNAGMLEQLDFINNTSIRTLSIGFSSRYDLSGLSGNETLESLELWKNSKIVELSLLQGIRNLNKLVLQELSKVVTFPDLTGNTNLEHLELRLMKSLTDFTKIVYIPNLQDLKILQMHGLTIKDCEFILKNTHLKNAAFSTGKNGVDAEIRRILEAWDNGTK
jgi:hypothetical protein